MTLFDRRRWLKTIALTLGSLSVSRMFGARPASAAPGSDGTIARLSLNENPFGPSPLVSHAIQREFANLCRYTGPEYDALVGIIADKERMPREQIILGEILEPLGTYLSLQGGPGGEFIYSDPGYTR